MREETQAEWEARWLEEMLDNCRTLAATDKSVEKNITDRWRWIRIAEYLVELKIRRQLTNERTIEDGHVICKECTDKICTGARPA